MICDNCPLPYKNKKEETVVEMVISELSYTYHSSKTQESLIQGFVFVKQGQTRQR